MTYSKWLAATAGMVALAACETANIGETEPAVAPAPPPVEAAMADEPEAAPMAEVDMKAEAEAKAPEMSAADKLAAVLDAQPEATKARYDARNPAETLAFFGIEPGMTVAEALPGGGWYSKILMPYLGEEGKLIGAHYPDGIWTLILPPNMQDGIDRFIARSDGWAAGTADWGVENGAKVSQYKMTSAPDTLDGKVDAVLFIRALHNLARTEDETGYKSTAVAETFEMLKPGGIVGVVQHRAPEDASDDWADGDAGYLKQSAVIATFEAAGFVLEDSSEINANPKDTPTESDIVWRLAPSFGTTEEGSPEREVFAEIGESDRMTLRFRKPT